MPYYLYRHNGCISNTLHNKVIVDCAIPVNNSVQWQYYTANCKHIYKQENYGEIQMFKIVSGLKSSIVNWTIHGQNRGRAASKMAHWLNSKQKVEGNA